MRFCALTWFDIDSILLYDQFHTDQFQTKMSNKRKGSPGVTTHVIIQNPKVHPKILMPHINFNKKIIIKLHIQVKEVQIKLMKRTITKISPLKH